MRVALVHEWLSTYAGSERVVEQLLMLYPHADLFCVVDFLSPEDRAFLMGHVPQTSFIQKLPGAKRHFRHYLPLMPLAIEQLDLSDYDLVISSHHAVAKGVITGPDQLHLSYVHTPMRYAWDLQHQYLHESGHERGFIGALMRAALHYLRNWDVRCSNGVDAFAANSQFIARRIHKIYRREALVIPPPVDVRRFELQPLKDDFYLLASRMVPYKRMPLVVEAFAHMPDKRLVVVGDGPDMDRVRSLAGANIEVRGYLPADDFVRVMQQARAFVFAAEEDFGIAPVEALACGTPVIAYGRGGVLDTVVATGPCAARTGLFFEEQSVGSIIDAIKRFENLPEGISSLACRAQAERFAPEQFRERVKAWVDAQWRQRNGLSASHTIDLETRVAA